MLYFFYMSDERILQSSGRQSISFHHIGVEEEEDHLFLLDSRVLSLTPFFPLRLNSIIPHVSPTLS